MTISAVPQKLTDGPQNACVSGLTVESSHRYFLEAVLWEDTTQVACMEDGLHARRCL